MRLLMMCIATVLVLSTTSCEMVTLKEQSKAVAVSIAGYSSIQAMINESLDDACCR